MKALILALSLVSTVTLAETATISIEGMHCAGCKEMITKKVCDDAAIKKTAESCDVKVTDADKKTGEITITTKGEEKVDVDAVKRQLAATGEGYKVANVEVKNLKNADGTPMTPAQQSTAAAATEMKTPGTKTITTTTRTETETVGADGKVEVKTETKVKKIKTASKTTTKKANK